MKNKMLFVSYGHEITNLASTIQNHRLIGALKKESGFDVEILARSHKRGSNSLFVWTPNLFIIDRVIYKVCPFLLSVFSVDRLLWSWKAFGAIRNHLQIYDYIIIPYEPYTTRLLHKKIRRYCSTKIIALLYDPYYDNIFFSQSVVGKYLRLKIEHSIVEMSNCIIVNNPRIYDTFIKRYKGANIQMMPLCGKEKIEFYPDNKNDIYTIVHAGNIGGERSIDNLNSTVTILKKKTENLSDKLNILLYGTYCQGYEKVIAEHNDDTIIFKGRVSWDEIGIVLAKADALLLIDPMDGMNYSYPSKLCEYFQYRKVIIGFSGKGTPSYFALKESSNIVHSGDEDGEMADEILNLITNRYKQSTPERYSDQFYPCNVVAELAEILSTI